MMLLPLLASAHDIAVKNADGVTIYYKYTNNGTELAVTYPGSTFDSYSNGYTGNVVIPDEVTYMNRTRNVTRIGSSAFRGCSGLTSVTIPNSVTSIDQYAFTGCTGLTTITIPNSVTKIGMYAFANSTGLTTFTIPNNVTSIDDYTFQNCTGLVSVTIGNSVTSIGNFTFQGCSGLTSVTIGNSVTSIGQQAFQRCTGLTTIIIPNSVTKIGWFAFNGCTGLTSITIPNSVTWIGGYVFDHCSGLTSAVIGNGVTSIDEGTFRNCSGMTSVTIGNSVTSIGNNAFQGCSHINRVIVPNIAAWCGIKFDGRAANPLYHDSGYSACYLYSDENTKITDLIIPSSVTSIGDYAFISCSGLNSVTIGNSVTSIGIEAFDCCLNLTSVTIGNSVTSIGDDAFSFCSGLEKVIVPDIAAWCGIKFGNYGANPLHYAKHLYSDEYTEITDLVVPNSVTSIGSEVFRDCNDLTSVTIGNSVTSIGDYAFKGCTSLTSVTIGFSVTDIGSNAFGGVDIPTIVSLIENPFKISGKTSSSRPFTPNTFNNATLYVPKGTIDKYKATSGWKDFFFIEEGNYAGTYKLIYMVDDEVIKSYDVIYGETITPEPAPTKEGYTFSGWSEIPETMPAHDVTVTGTFSINKYKLTYTVDGEEYKSSDVEYGATITPETAPTKEGYTFSGWSEIPETMPAHDVTVTGSFTINSYKLTYMIDDIVYKETMYEYGATINPEPQPEGDYATFEWKDLPQTMPSHDVVVYANYTSGIIEVLMTMQRNIRIYSPNGKKLDKLQKGFNIVVLDDGTVKKVVVK